jgi:hypothetical protein
LGFHASIFFLGVIRSLNKPTAHQKANKNNISSGLLSKSDPKTETELDQKIVKIGKMGQSKTIWNDNSESEYGFA